jgi:succinate-semialdehyde dehydrogenase/glutarate-semialdehyde dehydrogenase
VTTAAAIDVVDPATGEPFAQAPGASTADCVAAVDRATEAAAGWAATAPRERAEILRRAFELMRDEADGFAERIVRENGKVLADARGEVAYAAEFFRWYAEEAVRIGGELRLAPGGDKRIMVLKEPIGVSLLITPWNFPLAMATRKLAPALAAGCTVVLKPASETPLSAFAAAELLARAGVPEGVVQVVCPQPPGKAVAAMMAHSALRAISFTGSTEVGSLLLAQAAPRVLRCSMELGGNAPVVVLEDAELETAVQGALVAKMRNGGAACTAANRVYVHASIEEAFTARFVAAMGALRLDDGLAPGAEVGALVSQQERDRVAALVSQAADGGAAVLTGGATPDRPGFFYPPTVLAGLPEGAPILDEEIFGPVAPITAFDTEDEAVARANDTEFGLVSYLYTSDLKRALRVCERLEAGMIGLNQGMVSNPAAPFGGIKQSGLGREGGKFGIDEFLETKYIAVAL